MIDVKNLTKYFNQHCVLKDITFNIEQSNCVALIGTNGAGKTTLINCLLGEIYPEKGIIEIDHQQIHSQQFRSIIGVLSQDNVLPNDLTVKELISFYRTIYKDSLALSQINDLLLFTPQQQQQLVSQLSGGQRRLLAFVLILIGKPKLLLLDEPTASMDTVTRLRFWEIIEQLKMQGVTILYTSHYIEEIEYTADRILVLQQGELIYNTTVYALKAQELSKQITIPKQFHSVVAHSELIQNIVVKPEHIQFSTNHLEQVYQLLLEAGCTLNDMTISQHTLLSKLFNESEDTIA